MHINEAFIVSVDFSKEDTGVLIVGKQNNGKVEIVNAFQGEDAWALFQKLTLVKKEEV